MQNAGFPTNCNHGLKYLFVRFASDHPPSFACKFGGKWWIANFNKQTNELNWQESTYDAPQHIMNVRMFISGESENQQAPPPIVQEVPIIQQGPMDLPYSQSSEETLVEDTLVDHEDVPKAKRINTSN